ncbi:hypothetical protein PLICRDRAFT_290038 [Plicaturopsis crispa FD-325 SS-3]|nr:hypothetical protein PLICRDRAFT_290038 [Plicaturopsis crispa FD-325 SS-3]
MSGSDSTGVVVAEKYGGRSALLIISAHNSGAQFKCARKIESITRTHILGYPEPSSTFPDGHRHLSTMSVSPRSSSVTATTTFGLDPEPTPISGYRDGH